MKKRLSKSDIKALNEKVSGLGISFDKKDAVDFVEEEFTYYLKDGEPVLVEQDGLFPHLKLLLKEELLPIVVVDMGAVRFVTNGADVMRPGITKIADGIKEGDFVAVVDETHGKPLAVARARMDSEGLRAADGGKVLQNVHYVGDKLWNLPLSG